MKKLILFLILILSGTVLAQDMPQVRPWTQKDVSAEVGNLHIQIAQLQEFTQALQAKIRELQAENAKLKADAQKANP